MAPKKDRFLAFSIMFAALVIGGSLIFFATQLKGGMNPEDLQTQIFKGIDAYVAQKQDEYTNARKTVKEATVTADKLVDDDAVLGDKDAPITIVEFSDYECPFCKKHFVDVYPLIKKNYIDTGKAKLVFRDYPLSFHNPLATKEAIAAECVQDLAGDEAFFEYHDLLFKNTESNGKGLKESQLYDFAAQVGADAAKFKTCLDNEEFKDEVAKDIQDGSKAGVSGTPGFIINGTMIAGAETWETFQQVIEAELKKLEQ